MRKHIGSVIFILLIMMLTGCQYIPDYKFSTDPPSNLICGIYVHDMEGSSSSVSSRLTLYNDGTYKLDGETSDEYDFFPAGSGTYRYEIASFDVSFNYARGNIIFTSEVPVIGNDTTSVSAIFYWTSDPYNGPLSLVLEFSSQEVVNYTFNGRVAQ